METLTDLENELDIINLQLGDIQDSINRGEAMVANMNEKEAAAKELLAEAELVLAQPPRLGVTPAARYDKQKAEEVMARISVDRPVIQKQLDGCKKRLAVFQERKAKFPMDELQRQRKLDKLRRQVAAR
jgi:hypothetical protein